jgi:hypothetical protein
LSTFSGPARAADIRSDVSSIWRRGFAAAGRYRPMPAAETEIAFVKTLPFKGDAPVQISNGAHEQGRMKFRLPRPLYEEAADIVVTPKGGVWRGGCFEERYSAGQPGLRMLAENRRAEESLSEAVIIQCAHNDTYGDWVSEYLVPVLRDLPLSATLLLPAGVAAKPFAARDLDRLGVEWRCIDRPLRIARARILRQQKFFVHFTEDEARLLKKFFGEAGAPARPGGIVYLSRYGERSDVAERVYPSLLVEDIVKSRGGRVIRTHSASREDYAAAAGDAETLIFDHGSAFYNAVGWPARRIFEIVADSWWNNAFLMLSDAAGVHDYTIIRGDLGEAHVRQMFARALDAPLDASAAT